MAERPERNLALELVRVTEAAALAASRWMGRGDEEAAELAAVAAMRLLLDAVDMQGVIVIGEDGPFDGQALTQGQTVGCGGPPTMDVALDAIDGATSTARGGSGALSVVALAERGTMAALGTAGYMEKIAVGPEARDVIDIGQPVAYNLTAVARALGKQVDDLTVVILDRPRHRALIAEIRAAGARIRLIADGDVAGAIAAASADTGIDLLLGVGGAAEAVISAAAIKCMGGGLQCRPWQPEDTTGSGADRAWSGVYTADDLVRGDNIFFAATGITDGELLDGVRFQGGGARTSSIVMRSKSGTIRQVVSQHRWDKLMAISEIGYAR